VLTAVRPTVAALAGAMLISLLSLSALPAYGAEGARTATMAASWLVVGYSVWTNFANAYLSFLGLTFLPVVTAMLLLTAVVVATFSLPEHNRRAYLSRPRRTEDLGWLESGAENQIREMALPVKSGRTNRS
jgi:hypothetical protein